MTFPFAAASIGFSLSMRSRLFHPADQPHTHVFLAFVVEIARALRGEEDANASRASPFEQVFHRCLCGRLFSPRWQVEIGLVEQEDCLEPRLWETSHTTVKQPPVTATPRNPPWRVAQKSGADHRQPNSAGPGMRARAEQGSLCPDVRFQSRVACYSIPA